MRDVDREVAHEVEIGNCQTAQDFGQISPLHQGHFFPSFHSTTLCTRGDWMLKINGVSKSNYMDRIEGQSIAAGEVGMTSWASGQERVGASALCPNSSVRIVDKCF